MPFSPWQVLVLAVVQGITEFLPISSDGHLVVVAPLLFGGSDPPADMTTLNIVLHMGTLGSILIYYQRRIWQLLGEDRRTIGLLAAGSVPAALVGGLIEVSGAEWLIEQAWLAGFMLPVTGLVLIWISRQPELRGEYRQLTWRDSLLIGFSQAAAILPGLSRSGSTIATGVGCGLSRPAAATYSFLLAIPVLAGAGLLKFLTLDQAPATPAGYLALGAGVSLVVGLLALWCLERVLQRGRLHWFGWYCIALGITVLAWQFLL